MVWIAGGATAALPSLRDDLRAALTLRRLIGSISHACSGDESPMPVIGALVVVVSDDLGHGGSAASIEDAAKATAAASLKAAGVEAAVTRVVVVPVADDTSGSMELAAGIAADAALEACATLAVEHLQHSGRREQHAPGTEDPAADSGSEVDLLNDGDDDDDDGGSGGGAGSVRHNTGRHVGHSEGPRPRVSLCTGRELKTRIHAVPSLDRLPAIPNTASEDVNGDAPAWLRLQPPASLQAKFVTDDAVAALRAHLRRQADQRIAYAVGEGRVAELEPSSRTAWIREVEAEAAGTGANVHGIFFESTSSASSASTAPSLAAEAQGRYMEQLPGIVAAHCDFIKRAVLEERQSVLASRLLDKAVEAMDAMMVVRDVRAASTDDAPGTQQPC
jgi:hypothetical protein